ncbi:hypothetical protein HAX54_040851 [Datura stramonium]|uniref:Uncharacterized protein n=1 Tax=Datura stramonium TaxID=4076 RepID=A0ABS8SKV8_DATST|nr:hypothetical protein [Datura stramonium]
MTTTNRDESDKDSTASSSITMPESSRRSWMSSTNLSSFSSRRSSISLCNSSTEIPYFSGSHKPHKSNQIPWELIRRIRPNRVKSNSSISVSSAGSEAETSGAFTRN